jgi:hypothetical protein
MGATLLRQFRSRVPLGSLRRGRIPSEKHFRKTVLNNPSATMS